MCPARGSLRLALAALLVGALSPLPQAGPSAAGGCPPLCHCHGDHLSCSLVPFHRFPHIDKSRGSRKKILQQQRCDINVAIHAKSPFNLVVLGAGVRHVSVGGARLGALHASDLDARPLRTLVLVECRLHRLQPGALASMGRTLASLDLAQNEFTEVPTEALRDLEVLNWLNLQSNRIADLDPETEWGSLADSLASLSLANNQLRALGDGALATLRHLVQLDLEGNRLHVLSPRALPPSLAHLRLSDNLLGAPPCAALVYLPRLRRLQLRANGLRGAANASACRAPALLELDLALNELEDASPAPAPRAPLRRLILDLNSFTAIPPWVLEGGARLERLSLSHNRVARVSVAAAHALRSLARLDLDHNALRTSPDALRTLLTLRRLDLTSNLLRALPQPPPHLRYLALGTNLLTTMPAGLRHLAPGTLEYLDVSYNRITALETAAFGAWAGALAHLDLRGNRLARLAADAFPPTLPLRELALSFNDLDGIEPGALANLTTLQTLELSSTLAIGDFPATGAEAVGWLGLDNNGIQHVSAADLLAYPALVYLNLDFNRLTDFPSGDALGSNGTARLRELRLASNHLSELRSEFLRDSPELRSVDLSNNRIGSVSACAFSDLPALRRLDLAGNRVERLAPAAFGHLPRLEELDLHGNLLAELRADAFLRVGDVIGELTLNASRNRIVRLAAGGGGTGLGLAVLDLSHNRLEGLEAAFFAAVGARLRRLTLAHNRLALLDAAALGSLPRLQVLTLSATGVTLVKRRALADTTASLDLSRNAIYRLAVEQFHGLRHLRHLRLADNRLRTLPRDCLRNTVLEHLDLADNELTLFPYGALGAVGFTLRRLDLARNRLDHLDATALRACCELTDLSLAGNRLAVLAPGTLVPLSGLRTLDLSGNRLETDLRELTRAVPRLRELALADAGLRAAPALSLPELVELNLSGNRIAALREVDARHLGRLRSLNVAGNAFTSLRSIAWGALPRLVSLDISDNPIVRVPGGALDGLPRLRELRLLRLPLLEVVEPRAFRPLGALRDLTLEVPLGSARTSLADVVACTPALETLTLEMREETLDVQLSGVRAPRLRALEVRGAALRSVSADAFAALGSARTLTLRLRGTGVARLPAGLTRPLVGVPHLALDFSDNELVEFSPATLYPNLTRRDRLSTKLVPGGLVVSRNPLSCGCTASWLGAWLRRWVAEVGGGSRVALRTARASACVAAGAGVLVPLVSLPDAGGGAALECGTRALSSRATPLPLHFLWLVLLQSVR